MAGELLPLSGAQPSVGTFGAAQTYPRSGASGPLTAGALGHTRGTGTNAYTPAAAPAYTPTAGASGARDALLSRLAGGPLPAGQPAEMADLRILLGGRLEDANWRTNVTVSGSPGPRPGQPGAVPPGLGALGAGLNPQLRALLAQMPQLAALMGGGLPRPRRRRPFRA